MGGAGGMAAGMSTPSRVGLLAIWFLFWRQLILLPSSSHEDRPALFAVQFAPSHAYYRLIGSALSRRVTIAGLVEPSGVRASLRMGSPQRPRFLDLL